MKGLVHVPEHGVELLEQITLVREQVSWLREPVISSTLPRTGLRRFEDRGTVR